MKPSETGIQRAAAELGRREFEANAAEREKRERDRRTTDAEAGLRAEFESADNPTARLREQARRIADDAARARFITELDGLARLYPPETNPYRAPNGKPSNLSPTQWYLVRTTSFKQKYGDWEALAKREELLSRKPVSIIPNATLISNETKLKVIKDWENAISVDGYSTSLPKATIDKIRDHQGFSVMSMLESLLPLFENAVFINEEKNRGQYVDGAGNIHKNKPNFESYKNYINKFSVRINDSKEQEYFIRFTSKVEKRSKKNPNKKQNHALHSTAISAIEMYNVDSLVTRSAIIAAGETKHTTFIR